MGTHCAVLFAEVVTRRSLLATLPEAAVVDVVTRAHQVLRDATEQYKGRLVKTLSRGVFSSFPSAGAAALAAAGMHLALRQNPPPVSLHPEETMRRDLGIRIGAHYGSVIEEDDGDVFGDTVNVAARLMKMAKGDQTLSTGELVRGLPEELRSSVRYVDRLALKGKAELLEVNELIWEIKDLTMPAPAVPAIERIKRHERLCLRLDGTSVVLGPDRPTLTLGRHPDNDLVCKGSLASRQHAEIQFRGGRFNLIDRSSNGTFVIRDDGQFSTVHRERHMLDGRGQIALGERPSSTIGYVIHYECE